jgi:ABC-type multidrug transport system ATPase subunit
VSAMPIFQIEGLQVNYGFRTAVDSLSLSLQRGMSLGLLGLNGAGKTSTIAALLGMLRPRRGTVRLFGEKPGSPRLFSRLGFAPEEAVPPEFLSGEEYLSFVGELRVKNSVERKKQVSALLQWFELDPAKRIRQYSKGMRRRLILAQAFLGNPDLLILDEPLNGLDPLIIIKLRERLEAYRASGGTVLYSSHILNEVEKSCSDIAILFQGKLILNAPVPDLVRDYGSVESAFAAKHKGSGV